MIIVGNYENTLLSAEAHYRLEASRVRRLTELTPSMRRTESRVPFRSSVARTDSSSRL